MKKIALYAGSFDPVTRGHLNIIRRALDMFDEVVVAIGVNYEKKGLFTAEERMRLIYDAVDKNDLAFGRCLIRTFDGLAADYAKVIGAKYLIKGARTTQDFDYERLINDVSLTQQCDLETVLLFSDHRLSHVSSSAVKVLAKHAGIVKDMVTPNVRRALDVKNGRRIVGVTGTIGSGKSTLCRHLVEYYRTAHYVNLDEIARSLFDRDDALGVSVRDDVLKTFGTADRKELGTIVFGDKQKLMQLNELYRTPMLTCLRLELSKYRDDGVIFLEGALLFEFGWEFLCSTGKMIVVKTPDTDTHIERLRDRGHNDVQIARRIDSQLTMEEKLELGMSALHKNELTSIILYDTQKMDSFDTLIGELKL